MDWGLAMTVGSPGAKRAGMGGTPAYMAPEMAAGPLERVGFHSDIYLLGAILYEIVTGKTPHTGANVSTCLLAAAANTIQPPEKSGELIDIAMKAMASDPKDRYATVGELQDAFRQYRSHSESILLSTRAEEDLATARTSEDYEYYARAQFGFQEAFSLWEGNVRAKKGIGEATLAYASQALKNGDFDLGAKLLNPDDPAHAPLLKEIRAGQREREARVRRLKTARRVGVALLLTIIAGGSVAFFWIRAEKDIALANAAEAKRQEGIAKENATQAENNAAEAKRQEGIAKENATQAEKNADEAKRQEGVAKANATQAENNAAEAKRQEGIAKENATRAENSATEAKKQEGIAKENETKANKERQAAEDAKEKEAYHGYIASIGLAAAKIEENAFDRAATLLKDCPEKLRDWEWGRLMFLCTQGRRTVEAKDPIEALAFTRDGKYFAGGGWGGTVRIWETASGKMLQEIPSGGDYVFAVAFSPDGRNLAVGSNARPDYIRIYNDWQNRGPLKKVHDPRPGHDHTNAVLSLAYSRDGKQLLSGSYDNTARLWDLAKGTSRVLRGHEWWVCSAAFSPDEKQVVTACQDGSVMIWDIASGNGDPAPALTFLGHTGPVYAAQFSPDGKSVVSAGYDKHVLVWQPVADKESPGIKTAFDASLDAHTAGVRALQFSADGSLLFSAGQDNTVRIWDFAHRKLKTPGGTLRGHSGRVQAIALVPPPPPPGTTPEQTRTLASQVRSRLISGGLDGQVKIWDVQGYREELVLGATIFPGHKEPVLGASFAPDGRRILSASRDRTARLWDISSGAMVREFQQGHQYLATTAVFFPLGDRFLTAAVDNSTRIWDVASGAQLRVLEHTGLSAAAAISADGRHIATGGDNKTAKLWDAASGELLGETPDHEAEVTAVAFSPDGSQLFTGDAFGRCRLWQIAAKPWSLKWSEQRHSRGVTAACFLPDGKRILTASSDRTVAQSNAADGAPLAPLGHPGAVTSMTLAGNGRQLLTTCSDGKVRLWDIDNPAAPAAELPAPADETINAVAFSHDDSLAVTTSIKKPATAAAAAPQAEKGAAGQAESYVRLWDVKSLRQVPGAAGPSAPLRTFREANAMAWATIFSGDGGSLLTVIGNEARLFNRKSGLESMAFIPQGAMASAHFSPNGKWAVTGSWDNTARIWNIETGLVKLRLAGHGNYVNDAVFSPDRDGKWVATAGRDNQAILWNAATGGIVCRFAGNEGHSGPVTSVAFDPKGERLVTASQDKTARLWDVGTGILKLTLAASGESAIRGHTAGLLCAVFSPDGKRVLTGGEDNRAILWDAETGKPILQLQGHTAAVTSVSFSHDGKRAVTGSRDGTAKLWELKEEADKQDGSELLTLKGHSQEVTAVAFSDDGRQLLTGSLDGTIILWPANDWEAKPAAPDPVARR
jgi:WD40 repeat protein